MSKKQSIIHDLRSSSGFGESSRVYMITDLVVGDTTLVIEKTYTERYPVTKYEEVMELYEQLNRGGGRQIPTLKDLTK